MEPLQRHNLNVPCTIEVIATPGASGYRLLDSGGGRKLERFGSILVDRPELQALWHKRLPEGAWAAAHAVFSASGEDDEKGKWRLDKPVPDEWPVTIAAGAAGRGETIDVGCRLAGLWHLGLFPEQRPHWEFMIDRLHQARRVPPRVLNLFGYTGAATLLAGHAGADVTHVDASKKAVAWGRNNQALSRIGDAKIRWIVEDAMKFVAREVRRGKSYDVILLDPPKFGRGPDGEVFDLMKHIGPLVTECAKLLAPGPSALILTIYAIRASALTFAGLVAEAMTHRPGNIQAGELALIEDPVLEHSAASNLAGAVEMNRRLLPTSLFVRWTGAGAP